MSITLTISADSTKALLNELEHFIHNSEVAVVETPADQPDESFATPTFDPAPTKPVGPARAPMPLKRKPVTEKTGAIDSDGLVWDERIHSNNQKQNKSGKWQRRKGVDEMTFVKIKNELLGISSPLTTPAQNTMAAYNAIAPVPALRDVPVRTYEGFMEKLNELFSNATINFTYAQDLVEKLNKSFDGQPLNNITQIAGDQAFIDFVWETLERDGHA